MNKSKCRVCGSTHTVKNGVRKGVQTYLCKECGYQFRNDRLPDGERLWQMYQDGKQTVSELAKEFGTSASTIKRRLRNVTITWTQPNISGEGFVHLDATYWGRNNGVMVAIDSETGVVLYLAFIKHECSADYQSAVRSIENRGYKVKGIIIDGMKCLFSLFSKHKVQMCMFHLQMIVRRYLTQNPRLLAARTLKSLVGRITTMDKDEFLSEYERWKTDWKDTLERRTRLKNGKTRYRHRRLRSARNSIDFYLPYLFTFQEDGCVGMPNTNNKIEGTFTDLKKNLNNHSGMSEENRQRFISGFFLALNSALSKEKAES